MIRIALAGLAAAASLLVPQHVEPQISEAPAGSRTTFGFLVEHGCETSPTVQVSIQLPEGSFDAVPIPPVGWTGTVEDASPPVVTFTGGPLAADVEETFSVELVTPNRPGETVLFPTVQTCEVGEIGWIDPADESEEPAPRIVLTENADPITSTTAGAPTTTLDETTTTADDDASPSTSAVGTVDAAEGDQDDDDDSSESLLPTLLVGAVIGIVVVAVVARRRNRPST